jgi:hypothetical protein
MRPKITCVWIAWVDVRTEDVGDYCGGCGDSTLQNPLSLLRLLLFALVSGHEEDIEAWIWFLTTALLFLFGMVSRLEQRPSSSAAPSSVQIVCYGTGLVLPAQPILVPALLRLRLSCKVTVTTENFVTACGNAVGQISKGWQALKLTVLIIRPGNASKF